MALSNVNLLNEYDPSFPLLSALVLTYNHKNYIASCIKGLLAIDYPEMEIIVLDDGSTDGTFEIAKSFCNLSRCPIYVETQEHSRGRTSESSQKLVDSARGKYLLFMSGDDTLAPGFAATDAIREMEQNENITMAFARILHVRMGDCSQISTIYTPEFRALLNSGNPDKIYANHLCKSVSRLFLQGTIVRKSFVDEFGGFDTTLAADDYAFMVRAFQAMRGRGRKVLFKENNISIYREHPQSVHKRVLRQRDVFAQVVAKYIPPEHWPAFRMDYGMPSSLEDFHAICEHMLRHFGRVAEENMIPAFTKVYVLQLGANMDLAALKRLLFSTRVPVRAWLYVLWYALRKSHKIAYRATAGVLRNAVHR